jgi:putative oxidoreductase
LNKHPNNMSKLLSTKCGTGAFNVGTLLLRLSTASLTLPIGYNKLMHFAELKKNFGGYFGMPNTMALSLLIFAELFCSIFIILGLGTRIAAIPLIISMAVATFKAHHGDIMGDGQHAFMFMTAFLVILILGAGKISVEGAMGK